MGLSFRAERGICCSLRLSHHHSFARSHASHKVVILSAAKDLRRKPPSRIAATRHNCHVPTHPLSLQLVSTDRPQLVLPPLSTIFQNNPFRITSLHTLRPQLP